MIEASDVVIFIICLFLFIGFFVGLFFFAQWQNAGMCKAQYAGFENRYDYWSKCQIKYKGQWMPADNYRYGERID